MLSWCRWLISRMAGRNCPFRQKRHLIPSAVGCHGSIRSVPTRANPRTGARKRRANPWPGPGCAPCRGRNALLNFGPETPVYSRGDTAMSKRLAGMITRCYACPSVIDAAGLWCAGVIRHPGTRRARLGPAGGRLVMVRASLAGIASAALAVAALSAPAGAKVFEPGGQQDGRALPAAASGAGWSVTPSPNPRAGNGALNAVSCPASSVCTVVGLHVRESGLGVTLAQRRSGGAWAVQSTPNPPGAAASALNGVSCSSASACTGVGQFVAASEIERIISLCGAA
jgi:hypothetical protein